MQNIDDRIFKDVCDHRDGDEDEDASSITFGGSEGDMSAFMAEFLTARTQMQQLKDG